MPPLAAISFTPTKLRSAKTFKSEAEIAIFEKFCFGLKRRSRKKVVLKATFKHFKTGALKTEKSIEFPDGGFFKKLDDLMLLFSIFEISVLKAEDEI